jgi:aldose 1-epimerase
VIELRAERARCIVSPTDGGRLASLTINDRELLAPKPADGDPMTWGSFPMVPWAGRVRNGAFRFDGNVYQLDLGMPPHAIHGTVYDQPWIVSDVGDSFVSLSCQIGDHWPFGGATHQRIELGAEGLRCVLSVTADQLPMPAQVGWHPWFRKPQSANLEFGRMYERDDSGIPTGQLSDPAPGPWDDCFIERRAPLELNYEEVTVTIDSDCDHWVIYDQPAEATCVEPQSGPPDGFTIRPDRLEPGQTLQRWMTIGWRRAQAAAIGS